MPNEIDLVLQRLTSLEDRGLLTALSGHRPIVGHGGDQRDPTEFISCTCKKKDYRVEELGMPYFLHLFDVLKPIVRASQLSSLGDYR